MKIDNQDFTIYYSKECPYAEYEVKELNEYSKNNNVKINFIKIDSPEKVKMLPVYKSKIKQRSFHRGAALFLSFI